MNEIWKKIPGFGGRYSVSDAGRVRNNETGTSVAAWENLDLFAGGGGASEGFRLATGVCPDAAVNHDKAAIAMHAANHPATYHWCENLWDVNPLDVTEGRKVGGAWFSPDCTHFSKAKGSKPREKKIRGLAWLVVRWAARVRPRVIFVENVEEFITWGPLRKGQPDKQRKGQTFEQWRTKLQELGYVVEHRVLCAADFGSPTTRKRLFVIARCDGKPIVWPEPTHGSRREIAKRVKRGGCNLHSWRSAAEIIDWSLPCPSIFDTSEEIMRKHGVRAIRPLAEKTLKRIAEGVKRYVIESADPYIVVTNHGGTHFRGQSIERPLSTVTSSHGHEPLPTTTMRGTQNQLVAAHISKMNFGERGGVCLDVRIPLGTITTQANRHCVTQTKLEKTHHAEVRAFLFKYYGSGGQWGDINAPAPTITAKDRLALGLVWVGTELFQIVDIGMRMLTPRELFNAQGFRSDYLIDVGLNGKPATKTEQVARCGNSVCPQLAEALVRANYRPRKTRKLDGQECPSYGEQHGW